MPNERLNKRVVLAERPGDVFSANAFAVEEVPVRQIGDGEILLHNFLASIDPERPTILSYLKLRYYYIHDVPEINHHSSGW